MSEKESYRFKIWEVVANSHEKSLQRFYILRKFGQRLFLVKSS